MENKKILVVEDDKVLTSQLRSKLADEGFDVLLASNGKEGLDLALSKHPDLILVDILMPVMDGMEMTDKIRQDNWGKKVKIIVFTNLNSGKKVAEFLEQGAFDYMLKSDWNLEDVVKKVKQNLYEPKF